MMARGRPKRDSVLPTVYREKNSESDVTSVIMYDEGASETGESQYFWRILGAISAIEIPFGCGESSIRRALWGTVIFYISYVLMSCVYIFGSSAKGQQTFDDIYKYFSGGVSNLNLTIMLGFFTSKALKRYIQASDKVPETTSITIAFIASLKSDFQNGKIVVKDYARWALLCWVFTARCASKPFRENGPTLLELIDKKILTRGERRILEDHHFESHPLIIIRWMLLLLNTCAQNDRFRKDSAHQKNVDSLIKFKKDCGNMINKFAKWNMPRGFIQAAKTGIYYFMLVFLLARAPLYKEHQNHWNTSLVDSNTTMANTDLTRADSVHLEDLTAGQIMMLFLPITNLIQFFVFYSWWTFGKLAVSPFEKYESDMNLERLYKCHYRDFQWLVDTYNPAKTIDYMFPTVDQKEKERY